MADAVAPPRELPTGNGHQAAPPRMPQAPDTGRTYRGRFALGYVALAALLAAAGVGVWLVTKDNGEKATAQAWSDWQPRFSGELGAMEIARHVAHEYRHPNGHQLVGVIANRPHYTTPDGPVKVELLFVRPDDAQFPNDTNVVPTGNSIMYILCGTGQSCAIAEGEPSLERAALLRREALELALYTFHYDPTVQNVLAIMPPRAGQQPTFMLAFSRGELRQQTGLPLETTLPRRSRQTVENFPPAEQQRLDDLMQSDLYTYRLQQAGDGNYLYVLSPFQL